MRFPYPNKKLSSNSRISHQWLTKERQEARETGFFLAKQARLCFDGKRKLEMKMIICPPDRRKRDNDNVVTAFKSYRDGIFTALNLDDSLVHRLIVERGDMEKKGCIYVSLSEI
jgi:crossover junction endodeoxyribonuclease RusA